MRALPVRLGPRFAVLVLRLAVLALPPAMLVVPFSAGAGRLADGGVSAPELAEALKNTGYPADVTADRSGNPMIRSSTGKVLFHVFFFRCGEQLRCASVRFSAPFRGSFSQPAITAWNRDKRVGRAFLDGHGVAWLSMDVETSRGMTTEALEANIARWTATMSAFDTYAAK